MKNRIITFLLASTMIISLVGCGDAASAPANEPAATETSSETENETADETSTTVETKSADASDASFEYNGKTVSVLDDLETVKQTSAHRPKNSPHLLVITPVISFMFLVPIRTL